MREMRPSSPHERRKRERLWAEIKKAGVGSGGRWEGDEKGEKGREREGRGAGQKETRGEKAKGKGKR